MSGRGLMIINRKIISPRYTVGFQRKQGSFRPSTKKNFVKKRSDKLSRHYDPRIRDDLTFHPALFSKKQRMYL